MIALKRMKAGCALLFVAACAGSPSSGSTAVPSTGPIYSGSFGGTTFTESSVNGPAIELAKGSTEWTGVCGRHCLTMIPVLPPGQLPEGIAAFGVRESYRVSRAGFGVLLEGPRMTYEFVPKLQKEFPAELVRPLFWAVISSTDPSRELKSSDPPFGLGTMSSPSSNLVWVIDIHGFGEVGIVRRPTQ